MEFILTQEQVQKFTDWNFNHVINCTDYGTDGRLEFCFIPTGFGKIIKVKCSCGEILDLTEEF